MKEFRILTAKEATGYERISTIHNKGNRAQATDFAKLLGCEILENEYYKKFANSKKDYSPYWIDSEVKNGRIRVIRHRNNDSANVNSNIVGTRVVVDYSKTNKMPRNVNSSSLRGRVKYGYFPQSAADGIIQRDLENLYINNNLSKTGNVFSLEDEYLEYEYNGKRYVRVINKNNQGVYEGIELSNGKTYRKDDVVWVEVEPIEWFISAEKLLISVKILFAGIPFLSNPYLKKDFKDSDLKEYLNNTFSKEIVQEYKKIDKNDAVEEKEDLKTSDKEETKSEKLEDKNQNNKSNNNSEKRRKKNINPYNLDFDKLTEIDIIKNALKSNVSIFLHGKPGCGKSARVKQLDPDFVELNLTHLDPELLDGLAGEIDGKAVHIKPSWLEELEEKAKNEPDKIHILFLDELTNASPMMQAKAYGIVFDKKVAGKWKLPENVRVIAAGNELSDSNVANEMAEPLYDRFAHLNIETDVDSWLNWAVTDDDEYVRLDYRKIDEESRPKIHPAILAFIIYKGESVLDTPFNNEKPMPHANPRRWEMASKMLYESNNPNALRSIVGDVLVSDFIEFCKIPTITIEDVINGNYTDEDLKMNIGKKFATMAGLLSVDEENFKVVREFVKKLGPEMLKKFELEWTNGDFDRLEILQEILMEEAEKENQVSNYENIEEIKSASKCSLNSFNEINSEYKKYMTREFGERLVLS